MASEIDDSDIRAQRKIVKQALADILKPKLRKEHLLIENKGNSPESSPEADIKSVSCRSIVTTPHLTDVDEKPTATFENVLYSTPSSSVPTSRKHRLLADEKESESFDSGYGSYRLECSTDQCDIPSPRDISTPNYSMKPTTSCGSDKLKKCVQENNLVIIRRYSDDDEEEDNADAQVSLQAAFDIKTPMLSKKFSTISCNSSAKRKSPDNHDEQSRKKIKISLSQSEPVMRRASASCLLEQENKYARTRLTHRTVQSEVTTPKRKLLDVYSRVSGDQTPYSPLQRSPFIKSFVSSELPRYNATSLLTLKPGVGFVDTHCHLDFLFRRASHSGTFSEYREMVRQYFPVSYEGCVAIFCDPVTFANKSFWKPIIEEDGVWAAFGCHPHNSKDYNHFIDKSLQLALKHKSVKALGEIGLDYSDRNNCPKHIQKSVFERQLVIAIDADLPLVIHCRDAYDDCLEIMKKMVPKTYLIHLHCFTDMWSIAKEWMDTFPNLFIGITNVVTFPSAKSVHEVARNIPLSRLLLETDAPYFLPRTLPRSMRFSHPGMAIHVAAQIAAIKGNVSLTETLKAVRKNTNTVYGI